MKIRVCQVVSADLWAGVEVQLATTASYLVERPDVSLSAVLLNDGRLATELRRLGIDVTIVDETRHSAWHILAFLTRFFRDHQIDLVHTHRYKDTVLGTIAAKLAGVPHVIRTVHGLREPMTGWDHLKFRAYEALDQAVLRCFADLVIAVSKQMAAALKDAGYRPAMVTHIHNGIDLRTVIARRRRDEVRQELGVDAGTILIGTAGRLSPVKGQAVFLRAARLILEQEPGAKFLIAGGGPLEAELVASARQLRIDGACLFLGPRADVYDLTSAMDIFVLPSLNEGMPMAILEAMALGKPVVATAVGGVPEVVQHRVTGLLVPPGDERALADACLELARKREWAKRLGARAMRVVEEEFSHEQNGQALIDAYRGARRRYRNHVSVLGLGLGFARKALGYGARKVRHASGRRQMNRIRRSPAALSDALKNGKNILIVCHGNIIRSAFAANLIRQTLGEQASVSIASAGLEAMPGRSAHPTALVTAAARRVDLSAHAASPLDPGVVATSDAIFVMEIPQLVELRRRFPEARAKTFLLSCLAPDTPLEIRDPVDGDESVFQACFDHISQAVHPVVRLLSQTAHQP